MSCGSEAALSNTVKETWLNEHANKYQKLHLKGQILIFFSFFLLSTDINLEGLHSFYCRFVSTDVKAESDQEFVCYRPVKHKEYLVKL